jgi:predicted permease
MTVFKIAFEAVFPFMVLMTIGYICRKINFIDLDGINTINRVIFHLFLPVMIFYNLYSNDFTGFMDMRLIVYIPVAVIVVIIASFFIVPKLEKDNSKQAVIVQAIFRGNLIYVGMPVMEAVAGKKYLGLMALAITLTIIVYNIGSVVVFEALRKGKPDFKKIMKGIAMNPLIHGAAAGVLFTCLHIPIPDMALGVIKSMSQVATPVMLIMLGAGFSFSASGAYKKQIFWTCLARLVLVPAVMIPVAILLGFNNYEIIVVFAAMCAPTAVNTYTISQQMGGDDSLAAQLVAYASVFSIITIFLWIVVLQNYIPLL